MKFTNSLGFVDETPCPGCGWPQCDCLCMANDLIDWQARAEAAEDRAEAAEQKLREIAQFTLKTNTRAEAAEAENARLREQVAALTVAVTRSRMMIDFNEFVGALRSAGWYSKADAQHRHIRAVWETLIARAEAAEAE